MRTTTNRTHDQEIMDNFVPWESDAGASYLQNQACLTRPRGLEFIWI
jgi:hypothetical protein